MSRRYTSGQAVWISPCASGGYVIEDAAVVLDDLGDGYLVLQDLERVPSHGTGHFVQDAEVERLAA